ncbi:MAG: NAD-dependent epimerase/dehydratase family protein [Pseudomonadota bacterium]
MGRKTNNNRILLIGGTGFIGSNLVRYLQEKDVEVVVFHRKSSSMKNLTGFSFTPFEGDLTDNMALAKAMEGCVAVYNFAACGSSLKRDQRLREIINIAVASNVARMTREKGGLRLIHISSVSAVGVPEHGEVADEKFVFNNYRDPYAYTKYLGEQAVLREVGLGLDSIIVCPGNVIGSHGIKRTQLDNFKAIAQGKMKIYPSGGVCLTDIDDLVRGLFLCYEKGITGKKYILGGDNISFKEYFSDIAYATGGISPKIPLPRFILPWLGYGAELIFNLLKKETPITKIVGEMIRQNLFYSSELAIKELGYAITNWRKSISKTVENLRKEGLL